MEIRKKLALLFFLFSVFIPLGFSHGQELHQDLQGVWEAEVLEILKEENKTIPGTETEVLVQSIRAKILEGEREGQTITLDNDYIPLKKGDGFFINYLITVDNQEIFSVRDIDRRPALIIFTVILLLTILFFGGWQGIKAIFSLLGTFLVIIYILLPLLLKGYPPVLTSSIVATIVLFLAIYFTHGFKRQSTVAFTGTVLAVLLTSILSALAVKMTKLSGFATDEAVYLNFATFGNLDFSGLLLGGIIIGVLGVLDDIAITQVAVVTELKNSASHLSKKDVYKKALRVGREHAGALVNTLALAYSGAALPLLLLFSASELSFGMIINQEPMATEIVRTIVGSVGLILAIPITTLLAIFFLEEKERE